MPHRQYIFQKLLIRLNGYGEGVMSSPSLFNKGGCMEKKTQGRKRPFKKELSILADDFGLLNTPGVRAMIESATDYHKAHEKLMAIYNKVYLG